MSEHTPNPTVTCNICGESGIPMIKWRNPYTIYSCRSCEALFVSPMPTPEQLTEYYQGFLYRKPDISKIKILSRRKAAELKRFSEKMAAGTRFLDFGGGTGIATIAAENMGFEAHYHEIDRQAHEFVEENTSLDKERMYADDSEIPEGYFDFIWCDNVVEHVIDPLEFIQKLVARLSPGGKLVLKTPNCRNHELLFFPMISVFGYGALAAKYTKSVSSVAKSYFRKIWCCDPPRHLYSFSRQSLMKLCEKIPGTSTNVFYYKTPPFEYLLLANAFKKPNPTSVSWWARLAIGCAELAVKPIYFVCRPFLGSKSAGLGVEIIRKNS